MVVRIVMEGLKACAAAFQLLTRLPVPIRTAGTDREFRRSAVFFPVVGLVVGLIAGLPGYGFAFVLPAPVAAVLTVLLWVALTGGLHLDGLMDAADGLLSHRPPERMLEIMKDSRIGAMGVIACVLALMLKATLVHALYRSGFAPLLTGVVAAAVFARTFVPAAMAFWPYARKEDGMGGLYRSVGKRHAAAAGVLGVLLASAVMPVLGGLGPAVSFLYAGFAAAAVYLVGSAASAAVARRLGGLTGDVYGALIECLEIAVLIGFVVFPAGGAG